MSTACHQIEVFSRVLRTSITTFLEGGVEVMEKNLPEFTVLSIAFPFFPSKTLVIVARLFHKTFQIRAACDLFCIVLFTVSVVILSVFVS